MSNRKKADLLKQMEEAHQVDDLRLYEELLEKILELGPHSAQERISLSDALFNLNRVTECLKILGKERSESEFQTITKGELGLQLELAMTLFHSGAYYIGRRILRKVDEAAKERGLGGDGEIKWQIKKCVDPLLRFLPAGTRCETSGGVEWELVSRDKDGFENWRDLSAGGKTWISGYKTGTHDSISQCEVDGKLVPTEKDFELADGHGLREVIPTIESRIFWTKTRQSEFWAKAYFGRDGRIIGYHATDNWNPASVICVQ